MPSQAKRVSSDSAHHSSQWENVGGNFVLKHVLVNGQKYRVTILRPGRELPGNFAIVEQHLNELRTACGRIGSKLPDPSRFQVIHSRSAGICQAQELSGQGGIEFSNDAEMQQDCDRINDIFQTQFTMMASSTRLNFVRPDAVRSPPPPPLSPLPEEEEEAVSEVEESDDEEESDEDEVLAPAAAPQPLPVSAAKEASKKREEDLLRILDGVGPCPNLPNRIFSQLRGHPSVTLESMRSQMEWLHKLAKAAYERYFQPGVIARGDIPAGWSEDEYRGWLSAYFVVDLLAPKGSVTEELVYEIAGRSSSASITSRLAGAFGRLRNLIRPKG